MLFHTLEVISKNTTAYSVEYNNTYLDMHRNTNLAMHSMKLVFETVIDPLHMTSQRR